MAGRQTQRTGGETVSIHSLNTGQIGSINRTASANGYENWVSSYAYDAGGQRTVEQTSYNGSLIQNARATYDLQGRMTSWRELGTSWTPAASVDWRYDAVGNVRNLTSTYAYVGQNGETTSGGVHNYWYRYDAMNRLVTAKGSLVGGQIVRGDFGTDFTYFADGRRATAVTTKTIQGQVWDPRANPGGGPPIYSEFPDLGGGNQGAYVTVYGVGEHRETFGYDANGNLASVRAADSYIVDDGYNYAINQVTFHVAAPSGPGTVISSYSHDGLDRQYDQIDYAGGNIAYQRSVTYDAANRVTYEVTTTREGTSTVLNTSQVTTLYGQGTSAYALGAALSTSTVNLRDNQQQSTATTTNSYIWYGGAVQSAVSVTQSGQAPKTSSYSYNAQGVLRSVSIQDGRPRTISFAVDQNDQIVRRREVISSNPSAPAPYELYYRYGGRQLGYTGNNGTLESNYELSIRARTRAAGTGAFRGGATSGASYADFDQSGVEAITSFAQGSGGGVYSAREGDTLAGIALQIWGDASLWYKLAAANGLTAASSLTEGQTLRLPSGVQRSTFNASTLNPYDPASAIGDTSPTAAAPPKRGNKCGVFGAILLAVIAIAVTVVSAGAAAAAITPKLSLIGGIKSLFAAGGLAGALGGGVGGVIGAVAIGGASAAFGSIVSQGIGVATGIQDKFNWGAVGLAALAGGIGGGFSGSNIFGVGSKAVQAGVNGVLTNVVTQGLGVATGLQSRFDWAGVAAAGIGAGVGAGVSSALGGKAGLFGLKATSGTFGNIAAGSTAGTIAAAASRSAISGTGFGDNLVDAVPGLVANLALGGYLARGGTRGSGAGGGSAGSGSAKSGSPATPAPVAQDGPPADVVVTGTRTVPIGFGSPVLLAGSWAGESGPTYRPGDMVTGTIAPGQPNAGTTVTRQIVKGHPTTPHSHYYPATGYFYEHILPTAQVAEVSADSLGDIFTPIGDLGDAFSRAVTGASDGVYDWAKSRLDSLDGGTTVGRVLTFGPRVSYSFVHTLVNAGGSVPGAITHPERTLLGIAGSADALIRDETPVQVYLARASRASSAQWAEGTGNFGANAAMFLGPLKFGRPLKFAGGEGNAGVRMAVRNRLAAAQTARPHLIGSYTPSANLKFGTTLFGDEAHVAAARILQEMHPDVAFDFRVRPGQRGIDVKVLRSQDVGEVGFEFGEIKPLTASGERTMLRQIDKWGLTPQQVRPITYDANGNIYYGFR